MAISTTIPDEFSSLLSSNTKFNDWRDDLKENGYVVIKGAIPADRAAGYQQQAFKWISTFSDSFNIDNASTWTKENLPVQSPTNMIRGYAIAHEKFMWDARMEPGVVGSFEKLWGTEKLLVSFDHLNITFPNRKDKPDLGAWQHVDQSPMRRGLHCVQGFINLSEAGPDDGGLLVYPGSHKLIEEFFDTQLDKALWTTTDFFMYSASQLEWFLSRGIKPHKVCAEPGDLVLWDSRTIHQGCEPNASSKTIRTVIYVTYTPAQLAKPEALEMRAKIFNAWGGTTHWPHDNLIIKDKAVLDDGTRDPRDRTEPLEKPVLSSRLLKFAGVEVY